MSFFFSKKKKDTEVDRRRSNSGSDKDTSVKVHVSAQADGKSPRKRRHGSLHESSAAKDEAGKQMATGEREDREARQNDANTMPPISGSSSFKTATRTASIVASENGSASGDAGLPRGNTVSTGSGRRRASSKGQLPRLASAHSLHSEKLTPDPSLAPKVSSAPSMRTKPSSSNASHAATEYSGLSPMKRYSASQPAPVSLQPLPSTSPPTLRRSSIRSAGDASAVPTRAAAAEASSAPVRSSFARPVRIAAEVTTPDAKKAKAAADVTGSSSTSTTTLATAATPAPQPPLPLFSAMESVPKRPGASFRLQKRRKSSQDSAGGPPSDAAKSSNASVSANSASASSSGVARTPSPSPAFDGTRKERQANGGGSSHGRRREPVASFAESTDQSSKRPSASAFAGSFSVPLPPPLSTEDVTPPVSRSPNKQSSHHRSGSVLSSNAGMEDRDSLEPTPSIRKSRRSSMRMQTLHSAGSMRNTSIGSIEDIPRPLTRHASTLSSGQREALKRTPSFLSRSHTPPPSDLRESVQLRRVRRPSLSEALPSDTPVLSSHRNRPNVSFSSDSTILLSGVFPSSSDDQRIPSASRKSSTQDPTPPQRPKDAAAGMCSASVSLLSSHVRPASRAPRGLAANTPDPKGRLGSPTPGSAASVPANSVALPPVPVSRPPSARSMQQRQRQERSQKTADPPLSISPEPAEGAKKSGPAQPLSAVASEQAHPTTSNPSVFYSEAELFDYYGSFMLNAPQFDPPSSSGRLIPSPPPDEGKAVAAMAAKRGPEAAPLTRTPSSESKRNGMVSTSFTSEPASLGDMLPSSPPLPDPIRSFTGTSSTKTKNDPRPAAPLTKAPLSDPTRVVRPAGRQRQVNTYIDEDDDSSLFQLAKDTADKVRGSSSRTETTTPGYDYMLDSVSSIKYTTTTPSPSSVPAATNTPMPAKRLVVQPLPASVTVSGSGARSKLSSSSSSDDDDEEEDEEDVEGLLEGFRPALFDAAHSKRRGSRILFFLDREDSLSSMDVVIKPGGDGCSGATILISPKGDASPKQQSYSLLKAGDYSPPSTGTAKDSSSSTRGQLTSSTAEAVARPRVTMEPYVPLGSSSSSSISQRPLPLQSAPFAVTSANGRGDSHASKSFSLLLDPYGLQLDGSSPSLQASVSRMGKRASTSRNSSGKALVEGPTSIFLGTTSRFAPNPQKMQRPLANTFGYTAEQRRARAAALAKGVSAEAWVSASGIDDEDDEDGDEESACKEVFTDENGDEWYWEEVEDGEEGDDEDEEAGEAGETEEDE